MKRLICEMCGSADMLKKDGVFECQSCGCKYSLEEAKKMMVEGTVEVQGTVKVDNSEMLENYRALAENAYEAKNYPEAEKYVNKMLEVNPRYYKAWVLKGRVAAGTVDNSGNPKTSQCVEDWCSAYKFTPDEEKESVLELINEAYAHFGLTMIGCFAELYRKCPNLRSNWDCLEDLNSAVLTVLKNAPARFYEKTGAELSFSKKTFYGDYCLKKVGEVTLKNARRLDPEIKSNVAANLIEPVDTLKGALGRIIVLNKILDNATISPDVVLDIETTINEIKQSYITTCEKMGMDKEPIEFAEETFSKTLATAKKHIDEARKTLDAEQERKREEEKKQIEEYWSAHPEEKAQIENDIKSIDDEIESIRALMDEKREASSNEIKRMNNNRDDISTVWKDRDESKRKIVMMESELNNLGLFKGKEKKTLQDSISAETTRYNQLVERCKVEDEKLNKAVEQKREALKIEISELEKTIEELSGRKKALEDTLLQKVRIISMIKRD